jgi:hypothetical protein
MYIIETLKETPITTKTIRVGGELNKRIYGEFKLLLNKTQSEKM